MRSITPSRRDVSLQASCTLAGRSRAQDFNLFIKQYLVSECKGKREAHLLHRVPTDLLLRIEQCCFKFLNAVKSW